MSKAQGVSGDPVAAEVKLDSQDRKETLANRVLQVPMVHRVLRVLKVLLALQDLLDLLE